MFSEKYICAGIRIHGLKQLYEDTSIHMLFSLLMNSECLDVTHKLIVLL